MIIHIGDNVSLNTEEVLFILDSKSIENSNINKEFLKGYEEKIKTKKSIIITKDKYSKRIKIYTSNISSQALLERSNIDWRKVNGK